MSQGDVGERGDTGQRGVSGERGPKGDHGQHGDVGLTGDIGERGDTGDKGERGDTGAQGVEGRSTLLSRNIAVSYLLLAVVSFLILAGMTYAIVQNRGLIKDIDRQQQEIDALTKSTNSALCSFVTNLRMRVETTEQYLADVKAGLRPRIEGITNVDIKQSLNGQKATLASLESLHCPNGG